MVLPYIIKQNSVRLSLVQHCTIKQTVDRDVVRFINNRIATEKVPNWAPHEILKVDHHKPSKMFRERDLFYKRKPLPPYCM